MTDPNRTSVGDVPAPDEHIHNNVWARYDRTAAEKIRTERWHATYNAALTGLLAYPGHAEHSAPLTVGEAHDSAKQAADLAHGAL